MLDEINFLYVEDDDASRQVMSMIMTRAMKVKGLEIFQDSSDFAGRLEGLDPPPAVILLDVHVRPYDGFAMLEIIRQSASVKDARVIALTASVMNEEIEELRRRGFDGAIGKPLSVVNFPGLLARVVAGEEVWHVS